MELTTGQAANELRARFVGYVEGRSSLDDLYAWIAVHDMDMPEDTEEWDALAGVFWGLVTEFQAGQRDEEGLRGALRAVVRLSNGNASAAPVTQESGHTRVRVV